MSQSTFVNSYRGIGWSSFGFKLNRWVAASNFQGDDVKCQAAALSNDT
jgi:hypothetical protein